jgi:prepilin-type N-terminal cleavage/methylation domain-containing protein
MKQARQSGFTLSEMVISATIFSVVIGAPAALFINVNKAYRNETFNQDMDRQARRVLDDISARLKLSNLGQFSLPTAGNFLFPAFTNGFDFAAVTGYVAGAPVTGMTERFRLEYTAEDPNDGLDNDSDGLIDEQRIAWVENVGALNQRTRVIAHWVRESLEGEIPGNNIDDNANGLVDEGGLCFSVEGNRVNVWLTLERRMGDGTLITRTATKVIAMRN